MELENIVTDLNTWIEDHWSPWLNPGWFCLVPCLYRFVKNDMILREPLKEYLL
jgi:hypothetical protein